MSVRTLTTVLCLLALSGAVRAHYCPEHLCEDVAKKDPEKRLRAAVEEENASYLCYCVCDEDGSSLLHKSVDSTCGVCANLLVKGSSDCYVDVVDYDYYTPLLDAVAACNVVMVDRLLKYGANPYYLYYYYLYYWNIPTPVCLAALQDNPDCAGVVKYLVDAGAEICDLCDGQLPYDIAANKIVKDTIEQLGGRLEADGGEC